MVQSDQHAALFEDCIYYYGEDAWFSDAGDSGSAIIMNDDGEDKIIGIHFGGFTQAKMVDTHSSDDDHDHENDDDVGPFPRPSERFPEAISEGFFFSSKRLRWAWSDTLARDRAFSGAQRPEEHSLCAE